MEPKTARIIAPLPPKGSVAARHAGAVIHHLYSAGYTVLPSTATGPSYSEDFLHFAPKSRFRPVMERLSAGSVDLFVLYPEGLDFRVITQDSLWHRWLERQRRLKLVWRMLRRSKTAIVVYRPKLLKRPGHLAMVLLAGLAKLLRPRRVRIFRQSVPAEMLMVQLLGQQPKACAPHIAEASSFKIAAKQGAHGEMRFTPAWLSASLSQIPKQGPLYKEVNLLLEICNAYSEGGSNSAFRDPQNEASEMPFSDHVEALIHGVPLSRFMLHVRQSRRLFERFALNNKQDCEAYLRWYIDEAPKVFGHALPLPPDALNYFEPFEARVDTARQVAQTLRYIEKNAHFFGVSESLSDEVKSWLNHPITQEKGSVTRLELLVAALSHATLAKPASLSTPWQSLELKSWFAKLAGAGYPLLAEIANLKPLPSSPRLTITSISEGDTGLGQNRNMSEAALKGVLPKRPVYLHHVNADAIPSQMLKQHQRGAFHIGYLLWELETLPQAHKLAGEVLDEIWVPTRFLQKTYANAYSKPVTLVGKGFDLPPIEPFDLASLGIKPEQNSFLVSFDLHSSVARKNPLAAVLAFQMAFPNDPSKRLIIKTTLPPKDHWGDPEAQMAIIRKIAAKDDRITLLQSHMPFAQYLGLIAAVDVLVSPHRSEGFGYLPAYAMKLGTPVIATDYSGTTDFCTPETATVVPWRVRNVRPGEPIFAVEGAFWAEIDHEKLAEAMQLVLANPQATKIKSECGKRLMQQYYSPAALKSRYLARLTELGLL